MNLGLAKMNMSHYVAKHCDVYGRTTKEEQYEHKSIID